MKTNTSGSIEIDRIVVQWTNIQILYVHGCFDLKESPKYGNIGIFGVVENRQLCEVEEHTWVGVMGKALNPQCYKSCEVWKHWCLWRH